MTDAVILTVSVPESRVIHLSLEGADGGVIATKDIPWEGHVDNLLLTSVDNLLTSATLSRSALRSVLIGQGVDNNSSLYRIVQSFAAAVMATQPAV